MSTFQVELKKVVDDSYEIEIGFDLKQKLASDLQSGLLGGVKNFAVITDSTVAPLYAEPIAQLLKSAGYRAELFVFPAGEEQKTRETKAMLEDAMLEQEFRRDCAVLAVGGGVVTDLAGFLAGTFARGVPFVNYATTLLAAADASVGGKTAVDTPRATNLIGLFNQPKKAYIDVAAWKTLPPRQIASGLAETIKHACLAHPGFFEVLEEKMEDILALEPEACMHIAQENCKIKYEVVMQDERESGMREILNLGHTVGRAVETLSGYRLLHGEAVALGLAAQCKLSRHLRYLSERDEQRVISLLQRANLPTRLPEYIDSQELVKKLYTDKKVRDGKLRFVVQNGIGDMVEFSRGVFSTPIEETLILKLLIEMKS